MEGKGEKRMNLFKSNVYQAGVLIVVYLTVLSLALTKLGGKVKRQDTS